MEEIITEEIQHYQKARDLQAQGHYDLAALHYQLALELAPHFIEAYYELALLHLAQHEPEQAILYLKKLLDQYPNYAPAYFQLGHIYQKYFGAFEMALDYYQRAIQMDMRYAEAYYQAGFLYKEQGQILQAVRYLSKYVQLKPDQAEVYLVLGDLLTTLQEQEKASQYYLKALELEPDNAHALEMWLRLRVGGDPQKMMSFLIEMAEAYPHLRSQLACQAGLIMENLNNTEEARKCYQMALEDPELPLRRFWALKKEMLLPFIALNKAYQEYCIATLQAALNQLEEEPSEESCLDLNHYHTCFLSWLPLHFLAYTSVNPLPWRQKLARWMQKQLPPAPLPGRSALRSHRRRVGFIMNESGAIAKFLVGILQHLPTQMFDTYIFSTSQYAHFNFQHLLQRSDFEYILLSENMTEALEQVLSVELDILYFTEPNTQNLPQTLLASYRLAPVQCTSWLSSGSTGQPHMDYFLSSQLLEQPLAQRFYSEQLVLHQTIPTYFFRPKSPPTWPRSDYGLPQSGRLYLCPHVMYKLQPDFDEILGGILRTDPEGHLVLVTHPNLPANRNSLLMRFEQTLGDVMSRIWFLPNLQPNDYLGLLKLGDVMLDPLYFGGGTTSYEALGLGLPIVTLPGERLHGRITQACYLKMGLDECIVSSPQEYINKAVQIATDHPLNRRLREKIAARADVIFEDKKAISELVEFLNTVDIR